MQWKRLALFALLATAMPVVVAWTCALAAPLQVGLGRRAAWSIQKPPGFPKPNMFDDGAVGVGVDWRLVGRVAVVASGESPLESLAVPGTTVRTVVQVELQAGLPFRAFRASVYGEKGFDVDAPALEGMTWYRTWRSGIQVAEPAPSRPVGLGRTLPLDPVWPGLLANWGLSLFLVMPIPLYTQFRRWRRARREQCPTCGHQLVRGQPACPECGVGRGAA